jgi:hypothetical protein
MRRRSRDIWLKAVIADSALGPADRLGMDGYFFRRSLTTTSIRAIS